MINETNKPNITNELIHDLSIFFKDDKSLEAFYKDLEKDILEYQKSHINKISSLNPKDFELALLKIESLLNGITKIMTYVFLKFASNNTYGGLFAEYEQKCNSLYSNLLFFELEFMQLEDDKMDSLIKQSKAHSFYLSNLKQDKAYKLSLKEEQILVKTSSVGSSAFSRLFDELFISMKFKGINKESLNEEQILALLHNPKQEVRKKAQKNFTKILDKNLMSLTYILNIIRKDLAIQKDLRGYKRAESFRHISNQATEASVDSMIKCVNDNMDLVEGYYKVKGELLGLELKDYDRYAPLNFSKASKSISFEEGLSLTLECFKDFSDVFYNIALKATKEGWVDSHPREGKRGGAFSHGASSDTHPFVLLNHTGNRRDIFTIAHEFGHMVHQELSKSQGLLNMDTPLTTAETASVFAEMLLFDAMKKKLKNTKEDKKELIEIYAGKIEDIFSTLFRQVVMTNFERAIHNQEGELKTQDFNKIWLEENKKMFKGSVKLSKNYSKWWSYIPHFIHSPFYCYAYSYGQLLVLALFKLYKSQEDKSEFINKYIAFLSAGGSKSPRDLIKTFGFDIEQAEFWQIGIDFIKDMLKEFEDLLNN